MSTTSVVPVVLDALIADLKSGTYPYEVFEAWPGPNGANRMLFFGETTWEEYVIPTIKADRRQRSEIATVEWEQWTFGGKGTPLDVKVVRDDAYTALSHFEDLLAEDPTGGAGFPVVEYVQLTPQTAGPAANEAGWVYRVAGQVRIKARLS